MHLFPSWVRHCAVVPQICVCYLPIVLRGFLVGRFLLILPDVVFWNIRISFMIWTSVPRYTCGIFWYSGSALDTISMQLLNMLHIDSSRFDGRPEDQPRAAVAPHVHEGF